MKTAFVYSEDFAGYTYGPTHPLKPFRLKITRDLIDSYGLLSLPDVMCVEASPASDDDLLLYHTREYLQTLKAANSGHMRPGWEQYGLGFGDNPVFEGVFDWSALVTGASLQAAELVDSGTVSIAFNIAGGLHHALASRASGFCYINDPVVVISSLLKKKRRIAYVDIDAHHGDGVQEAFYRSDKVLTVSFHESGYHLFPGTGFENEIGEGEGRGYAVNIPLPPLSDDEVLTFAFGEVVPPLIEKFKPDIVVSQLGVDSFRTDPLAHLNCTTNGFSAIIRTMKDLFPAWIALGGGGYDMENVAKAWTLAWAIMNDIDLPDELPDDFVNRYHALHFRSRALRDLPYCVEGKNKETLMKTVKQSVASVLNNVLPLISHTS